MKKKSNACFLTAALAGTLLFSGCGDSGSSASATPEKTYSNGLLLVFGSDYSTGELRWADPEDSSLSESSLSFNQDAKLVAHGQYLYVLERFGADNVALVDLSKIEEGSDAVTHQVALESGANPSDIVVLNDSVAWLSLEGTASLLKIQPQTLKVLDSVSTEDFVIDGNVSPNMVDLAITGDTLIALMQRLDTYSPTEPGLVALYDARNGTLLDTIPLNTTNPSAMALYDGSLWVTTLGSYNASYGLDADNQRGLELVDLAKKTAAIVLSGEDFGGGLYGITLDSADGIAYIPVYASYGSVPLVACNLSDYSISTVDSISDAEGSLAFDEQTGNLFIGDRTYENEKVYVYQEGEISEIDGGSALAPYGIAVARW